MTKASRDLTINFMDGTKISYSFPEQGANAAAKQLKLEELLKNPFLIVIGEGQLTLYPVRNIKSIQMPVADEESEQIRLPAHVIRNAKVTRG